MLAFITDIRFKANNQYCVMWCTKPQFLPYMILNTGVALKRRNSSFNLFRQKLHYLIETYELFIYEFYLDTSNWTFELWNNPYGHS